MTALAEPVQDSLFDIDEPGLDTFHPIEFVATPLWLLRIGTLDGNAKYVYTALLTMYGDPDDGKRLKVEYPPIAQEQLAVYLRLSPHVVKRCITELQESHNCPRCRYRHALLRADRVGRSDAYRYRMVKCASVEELLPLAAPAPKRAVVMPFQYRQLREAGDLPASDAAADELDENRPAEAAPIVVAPVAADPKVGILREIQRYHKREISPGVLEAIAEQCFDGATIATRLEHALDVVRSRAIHEHRAITPTYAIAVLEEARRAPAGFDPENFTDKAPRDDRDRWELERIAELYAMGGERPNVAECRKVLEQMRTLIVAHLGNDEKTVRNMVEQVLTDPRLLGQHGWTRPKQPVRWMLALVKRGDLLKNAADDDGSVKYQLRFDALPKRDAAIAIVRDHVLNGSALATDELARCGVTGLGMREYLLKRVRAEVAAG